MDSQSNALRRPLDAERQDQLTAMLADLDPQGLTWVSGYVAGLAAERSRLGGAKEQGPVAAASRVLVLYAPATGGALPSAWARLSPRPACRRRC
jgi:hypothetical protein